MVYIPDIAAMRFISITFLFILFATTWSLGQCPSITVVGPSGVTYPGDEIEFRAQVGAVGPRIEFAWTVDQGTIVKGQGTPAIAVATDRTMAGKNLIATVEIKGLSAECEKTASETAPLGWIASCGMPSDEWDDSLKPNDQRLRLDSFFAELSNNPTGTGFIMLYITHRERLDSKNPRIQFVLKHARFRKFDTSRIWFALEFADESRTKVFRFPPGGDLPCAECLIIKGGDL